MATRKSVSKTRGDNNTQKFLLFVLILVICVSKGFSIASGAVTPEVELQQLTNEKTRHFNLQEATYGNNYRQQEQQQQQRQQLQVIANDLQEQPEVANEATEVQKNKQQQQQYPSSGGEQTQTSGNGKFVSPGNVINGNHATYVEPPADFKPIIYDYDKQQSQSRQPNESLDSSLNQMMPIFANRLSQIQQHQQQQAAAAAADSDSSTASDNPSSGDRAFSLALKPSIGRWSDWHDMSIEPDLASSDSSVQATFYSLANYAPFALASPAFITPYRTRYQARSEHALKGAKNQVETMQEQQAAVSSTQVILQGQLENDQGATKIGQNIGQSSISDNLEEGSVVKRTLSQLQIKGGQGMKEPNSASGPIKIFTPTEMPESEMMSTKLALNQQNNANSNNVKMQQNHDFNQQQASNFQASGLKQNQQQQQQQSTGSGAKSGLQQQQQKQATRQSKSNQRRLKRRRKSKTNTEVRIQQLVAASQHQQELLANGNKQVNGLAVLMPSKKVVLANQKQFLTQQYQPTLLEHSTGQQLLNQQAAANQLLAQQQLNNLLINSSKTNNRQQQQVGDSLERVFNNRQPIKSLNYQTLGNIHLHNRPAIIVKRFGNFPVTPESQQVLNASAPIKAAPHQQRKRKIKTQLPVGLSSWFLGGIRDLDGRHWHLPAEVISRLAVNDVDLVGSDKAPKVGIPVAGSVILMPAQNIDQVGAATIPSPSPNRIPMNQLVPR